jgi:hypothetical protein
VVQFEAPQELQSALKLSPQHLADTILYPQLLAADLAKSEDGIDIVVLAQLFEAS